MAFQRVQKSRGGRRAKSSPRLSVYPSGRARFNAAASEEWLEEVDVVEFYVDAEENQLGIARGGDPDEAWALSPDDPGYDVSFRTVLTQFGVDIDAIDSTVYLDLDRNVSEGLLVADLAPLFEEVDG